MFRNEKKDPFGARRGPFFRERGMPGPLVEVIVPRSTVNHNQVKPA